MRKKIIFLLFGMTTVFFSSGAMGARIIGHNKLAEVDDVQKMTFEFLDKNIHIFFC